MEDDEQKGYLRGFQGLAVERGLFPEDGKRGKKKFRFMRNDSVRKILRGFARSSLGCRMAWLKMKEWKKMLRNILMLWKRVLMLMLIRKIIGHPEACAKCRIGLTNVHNLRKHMVKTHYEFSL